MNIDNIKQINIKLIDPNGKPIIYKRYVNILTNEVVDESVVAGQVVEKIDISCAIFCEGN